jgi:hypothetical protein
LDPSAPQDHKRKEIERALGLGRYAGLGFQFAGVLLAFGALGWWLDGLLGTQPWLLIVGVFLGAAGAFLALLRAVPRPMTHTTAGTLIGLAIAGAVAWFAGGSLGRGILAGAVAGAFITGLCLAWQRHTLEYKPEKLVHVAVAGFLVKLAAVLCGSLALRAFDGSLEIADWRGFLVTFVVTAVLVLIPGTIENMRKLAPRRDSAASRRGQGALS